MSFPIEQVRLNSSSFFLYPDTKIGNHFDIHKKKTIKKEPLFAKKRLLVFQATKAYYFTFATIALNASGWFMAKSANTLRLISIPAACKAPIKRE